ncbi:glyoxalase [Mesorhizobium sp. Root157]|uniref:VOC family protein n=1 Tax=Mesorhizobium sp. Root157 TaxID=1736477 RepID=UPI0006FC90A2|nr:VOC family protein [Mesorhizobium sp. Root157]KQZ81446.1 glyoxalase [Mesorhizobium sp. Root157]
MPSAAKSFFWYELMTTDVDAAEAFYTKVIGWKAEPFDGGSAMQRYVVVKVGDRGVGGIMALPEEARNMGMPPAWVGYIQADDADATTDAVKKAGGKVHREPSDIPGVGRFSVVSDPQGAVFMLLQPNGPDQPPVAMGTPGHIGWRELYANDWPSALEFYSGQFGWEKDMSVDMEEMGIYQLFSVNGEQNGGMMNRPPHLPVPVWQFYFNVPAIDAAAKRVTDNGGKVVFGPMDVPGGQWVVNCTDPQGAHFGMVAPMR